MIYALVIVKSRSRVDELTYQVPADIIPYIKIGSQVVVPLRAKKSTGVVIKLTNRIDISLKNKIKSIISINKNDSYSDSQILTVRYLANNSFASLSEVASLYLKFFSPNLSKINRTNTTLYYCQGGITNRLDAYLELIKQAPEVVIITPLKNRIAIIAKYLELNGVPCQIVEDLSTRKNTDNFLKSKERVVVGSYSLITLPIRPGGLLIIDDLYHYASRSRKRPYLTLKQIGHARFKCEEINLVFGAAIMAVEDVLQAKKESWVRLNTTEKKPKLTIVKQDKQEPLPNLVVDLINTTSKKTVVVNSFVGEARYSICSSCYQITEEIDPVSCQSCGSKSFHLLGHGIKGLKKYLTDKVSSDAIKKIELTTNYPEFNFSTDQVIVITDFDRFILSHDYQNSPKIFGLIIEMSCLGDVVIVTKFLDHPILTLISSLNRTQFLALELKERKKYLLPPFRQKKIFFGANQDNLVLEVKELLKSSNLEIIEERYIDKNCILTTLSSQSDQLLFKKLKTSLPLNWYVINHN